MTFWGRNSENKHTARIITVTIIITKLAESWELERKTAKRRSVKAPRSLEKWPKVNQCVFGATHVQQKQWMLILLTVKCTAGMNSDLHTLFTNFFAVCAEINREPCVVNALGHLCPLVTIPQVQWTRRRERRTRGSEDESWPCQHVLLSRRSRQLGLTVWAGDFSAID